MTFFPIIEIKPSPSSEKITNIKEISHHIETHEIIKQNDTKVSNVNDSTDQDAKTAEECNSQLLETEMFFRCQRNSNSNNKKSAEVIPKQINKPSQKLKHYLENWKCKVERKHSNIETFHGAEKRIPKHNLSYKLPKKYVYKPKENKFKVDALFENKQKCVQQINSKNSMVLSKNENKRTVATSTSDSFEKITKKSLFEKKSKIPRLNRNKFISDCIEKETFSRKSSRSYFAKSKLLNSINNRFHNIFDGQSDRFKDEKSECEKSIDSENLYLMKKLSESKENSSYFSSSSERHYRQFREFADSILKPGNYNKPLSSSTHSENTRYFLKRFLDSLGKDKSVNASKLEVSINNILKSECSSSEINRSFPETKRNETITKGSSKIYRSKTDIDELSEKKKLSERNLNRINSSQKITTIQTINKNSKCLNDSRNLSICSTLSNYTISRDYAFNCLNLNNKYSFLYNSRPELVSINIPDVYRKSFEEYYLPFQNTIVNRVNQRDEIKQNTKKTELKTPSYGVNTPGVTSYSGMVCYICKKLICCCKKEKLPDDGDENYRNDVKVSKTKFKTPTIIKPIKTQKKNPTEIEQKNLQNQTVMTTLIKTNYPESFEFDAKQKDKFPLESVDSVQKLFVLVASQENLAKSDSMSSSASSSSHSSKINRNLKLPNTSSSVKKEKLNQKRRKTCFNSESSTTEIPLLKKRKNPLRRTVTLKRRVQVSCSKIKQTRVRPRKYMLYSSTESSDYIPKKSGRVKTFIFNTEQGTSG